MEQLGALFFELSSDERLMILSNLSKEALKLSHLAQKQNMTVTEASRHLQRLSDAKLIFKDVEGLYEMTPYGKLILSLLPSLGFVLENREYFLEHDTSVLPNEFVARFGELSKLTFSVDTISNLAYHEKIFREAEEFSWTAATQFHWSAAPIVTESVKRGVDFRTILPENIIPPAGFTPAEGVQRRTIPGFNVVVIVTEKEAALGLPYLNGKMDYAQFFGKDPGFINWSRDLFRYFWERAKPVVGPFHNIR